MNVNNNNNIIIININIERDSYEIENRRIYFVFTEPPKYLKRFDKTTFFATNLSSSWKHFFEIRIRIINLWISSKRYTAIITGHFHCSRIYYCRSTVCSRTGCSRVLYLGVHRTGRGRSALLKFETSPSGSYCFSFFRAPISYPTARSARKRIARRPERPDEYNVRGYDD